MGRRSRSRSIEEPETNERRENRLRISRIIDEAISPPWYQERLAQVLYKNEVYGVQAYRVRLGRFLEPAYWIPVLQRQHVWSVERQTSFCNHVFEANPVPPFLLWESDLRIDGHFTKRVFVLDGQQRLTAMGAQILRVDGRQQPETAARFALDDLRFHPNDVGMTMRSVFGPFGDPTSLSRRHLDSLIVEGDEFACLHRAWMLSERLNPEVTVIVIQAPFDQHAVDWFRSYNIPGHASTTEEIEAIVASFKGAE